LDSQQVAEDMPWRELAWNTQVQGPLGWGWQGPRRTERYAFQVPRPGLILANPAPVGILVVGTPSPWQALW
jgi:hypothetical protein